MKRFLICIVILLLLSGTSFATLSATKITGNTIAFSTTAQAVTLNSVSKTIIFTNYSTTSDCWIDVIGVGTDAGPIYGLQRDAVIFGVSANTAVRVPLIGGISPNTVQIDFATKNLGFISDGSGTLNYIILGETGDF